MKRRDFLNTSANALCACLAGKGIWLIQRCTIYVVDSPSSGGDGDELLIDIMTNVSNSIIGQERAIKAIKLGLEIEHPSYHIYVAGPEGAGRKSTIKDFLRKSSKNKPSPKDVIITYNFSLFTIIFTSMNFYILNELFI